jgi:DNA polymerase-1
VILFDGSALMYRAFYAIPGNFTNAQGVPTNATYGFATSFKKLLAGRAPKYGAVVFDAPGKTFRDEKYPEYKAQRPRMPSELREQIPWIDRVVEAHEFPLLRVPGYEADDVIGTLARRAREEGMEVIIVSADKDFAQLIDESVKMQDTLRDVTYDPELVRKKWGVRPEQMVDLLSLMGDKADNVPGVPGIGQKGAAKLLETYGDLATILDSTEELKGKQKKNLEEHRDLALLSQELVTIDTLVPLEESWEDLQLKPPDPAKLNALFKELQFYSLLGEEALDGEAAIDDDADYEVVTTRARAEELIAALPERASVAMHVLFEGTKASVEELVGVALSPEEGRAFYLPVRAPEGALGDDAIAVLRPLLEDLERGKVVHNFKMAWEALQRHGVGLKGIAGDVLLASFLVDPTKLIPHELEQIAKEYLQRLIKPRKSVVGAGKKERALADVETQTVGEYACHLADITGRL